MTEDWGTGYFTHGILPHIRTSCEMQYALHTSGTTKALKTLNALLCTPKYIKTLSFNLCLTFSSRCPRR